MTTKVKTELLDDDDHRSTDAAAAAVAEKSIDSNDNVGEDDQQSDKDWLTTASSDDVALDAVAAEEHIKKERKAEQILDLSRIADDDNDSADGIRYIFIIRHFRHLRL